MGRHAHLADGIGKVFLSAMLQDKFARDDAALELERHLCRREEAVRRADIVEQAAQVVRLVVVPPLREVRADERGTCSG